MASKSSTGASGSSLRSAYSSGMLLKHPTLSKAEKHSLLPIPVHMSSIEHCDLINKSTRTKQKFLFQLPGRFNLLPPSKQSQAPSSVSDVSSVSSSSLGRVGELADLDTANPTLYLDFPNGRIKMRGTLVYPSSTLLAVQFPRSKRSVSSLDCRGSFDHLIVLSEYWWIGNKTENPDELPLKWPEEFAGAGSIDLVQSVSDHSLSRSHSSQRQLDDWLGSSQEVYHSEAEAESSANASSDEEAEPDEDIEEEDEPEEDEEPKKKRARKSIPATKEKVQKKSQYSASKSKGKSTKKKANNSDDESEDDIDLDDESAAASSRRPKRTTRKEVKYTEKEESEEEQEEEEEDENEEEEEAEEQDEEADEDDDGDDSGSGSVLSSESDGSEFDPNSD